jgi:5'(3')-deoxyribonucleotidase
MEVSERPTLRVIVGLQCVMQWEEGFLHAFGQKFPGLKNVKFENCSRPDVWDNFKGRKLKTAFGQLLEDPAILDEFEAREGALWALHAMRTHGVDVRLLVPYLKNLELATAQLKWVHKHVGKDWLSYLVCTGDRTLLACDVLIDVHPNPQRTESVPWKQIVFDRPYNSSLVDAQRMRSWAQWKSLLGLDEVVPEREERVRWEHGSENSTDKDYAYLFEQMPPHRDCVKFCHGNEEDRNIIVISEGVVSASFKGPPDEVNNGLIATAPLHQQQFPLPLTTWMKRVVVVKCCVALRGLAVKLRKSMYREHLLPLMGCSDFLLLARTLAAVDFRQLAGEPVDVLKYCAFQIGQALALIRGTEIYTKNSLAEFFPSLRPFLLRNPDCGRHVADLEALKAEFFSALAGPAVRRQGSLNIFSVGQDSVREGNFLEQQSRCMVVDMEVTTLGDHVVCFGLEWSAPATSTLPTWPLDAVGPLPDNLCEVFFWKDKWEVINLTGSAKISRVLARVLAQEPPSPGYWYVGELTADSFHFRARRSCVTLVLEAWEGTLALA